MIFDGCLLASDIDHTLAEKDKINERTLKAIKYFTDNGGRFAIATGRHQLTSKWAFDLAGSNSPAVTFGCAVYDFGERRLVHADYIPETIKRACVNIIKTFPEIGSNVFVENDIYAVNDNEAAVAYREYMQRIMGKPFLFANIEDIIDLGWIKINFFDADPQKLDGFISRVEGMGIEGFCGAKSEKWIYEVSAGENSDKGSALRHLARHLGIEDKNVFAIGDFYNDLPMLKYAAVGAAVANAPDEVKQAADTVVSSCADGGVADFIDYIERLLKNR